MYFTMEKTKASMVIATFRKLIGRKFDEGHTLYPSFTNHRLSVDGFSHKFSKKMDRFAPGTQPWSLLPFLEHHCCSERAMGADSASQGNLRRPRSHTSW